MTTQERIINRIILDTEQGKLKWSCGPQSNLWTGRCCDYQVDDNGGFWSQCSIPRREALYYKRV